jgi:hypothetical protein
VSRAISVSEVKYSDVVTTQRSAEYLARIYGFKTLADLARSLPTRAGVLDLGAGASPLGREVALLRSDIEWLNVDYSYYDKRILSELRNDDKLPNLTYLAGDATKLDRVLKNRQFDVIFSYWLMPHLSLYEIGPATAAAKAMFNITKQLGTLRIGPIMSSHRLPTLKPVPAQTFKKQDYNNADDFSAAIVSLTKVRRLPRIIPLIADEVVVPYFGSSHCFKKDSHRLRILDPKTGKFISAFSIRGFIIACQVVFRTTSYLYVNRTSL